MWSAYDKVLEQLLTSYKQVKIGDPLEKGTLLGPLHTPESRNNFEKGIEGGKVLTGGKAIEGEGNFVEPTKLEISSDAAVVKEELFAPVLYICSKSFEEVVVINNSVPQGLSSSIFTPTGGGREAGSNTCKHTTTINYGNKLPLAQGINFG
ncbi:hypothetical protein Bca52824_081060 [Brassica carinata]|uniref:Aldehyde dehydrogenase domain-containing protein n=1 Tax=Brassica carinata TaxID=52824 RepID=A0A8X7PEI3_BRACI|nr:hypothetical protein Bca52824_081060 [Brassica carinata]